MLEFARSEFELSALQQDKKPLRVHLESIWRQTGEMPEQLQRAVALPSLTAHIWHWFCELNSERGGDMNGPARITSRNIIDWRDLTGTRIEPWELRAIRALDVAWMGSQADG